MKNYDLHELFIDELEDMLSSEQQIVDALPKIIKQTTTPDLKEALSKHLKETEEQVNRILSIFSFLNISSKEKLCAGMKGILKEGSSMIEGKSKSIVLDAAIISAAQKVEHYEIASYETLLSFANHLNFDAEIIELLQKTLDEEASAYKKLTKIADGTIFISGVNREAAGQVTGHGRKSKK